MFEDIKLNIFLSYSNRDKEIINQVKQFLTDNKCNIYTLEQQLFAADIIEPKNAIKNADLFIPVLTENFVNSEYARMELREAISMSYDLGLYVLPLVIDKNYNIDLPHGIGIMVRTKQFMNFNTDGDNTKIIDALNYYRFKLNIYKYLELIDDYVKIHNDKKACEYALNIIQYYNAEHKSTKSNYSFHTLAEAIYKYLILTPIDWAYEDSKIEKYIVSFKSIIEDTIEDFINNDYTYSAENMLKISYVTNDLFYEYVFNEYGINAETSDKYANYQVEIIKKYPYLKEINKTLIDSKYIKRKVEKNNNTKLHTAVAEYLYKSNELFTLLQEHDNQPFDFFSCLKMSYERLKDYCALIGESEIGSLAIEKIQEIDNIISNKEPDNNTSLEANGLKAILGIKTLEQGEYDVFISHKSNDTELASKLYKFLKGNMMNPFFDKECLPELGKSEYQEAIMEALNNSKHFIMVISDLEYLKSGWVKEEIDTFALEVREGRKNGNVVFVVTSNIMDEVIKTNKTCLPLQYRKFEIMLINEYKDKILTYLRD